MTEQQRYALTEDLHATFNRCLPLLRKGLDLIAIAEAFDAGKRSTHTTLPVSDIKQYFASIAAEASALHELSHLTLNDKDVVNRIRDIARNALSRMEEGA